MGNIQEYTGVCQEFAADKARTAVKDSSSFLQATLDAMSEGVILLDSMQNICHYNNKIIEMWNLHHHSAGTSNHQSLQLLMMEKLKHPEVYSEIDKNLYAKPELDSCDILELEDGRFFERHSRPQWLDNQIIGRILSFRDITKQIKAEQSARQSEEKFKMLFNNQKDGIVLFSQNDNGMVEKIIDVNEITCQWLGCSKDELLAMSAGDISIMMPTICTAIHNKQHDKEDKNLLYQTLYFAPQNSQMQLEMDIHSFEFNGENVSLCVAHDIGERKRMENEMAHLERLNLVGEMAAGIGHEVRNPMTTIRGFLQILLNKKECSKYWDHYQLMIDELDRANSIITEFLSVAKNRISTRDHQSMNEIIKSLVPLMEADAILANKYINLELTELPQLFLDDKEIRQLVLNMVRNSLDSMSPGGNLTIRTYMEDGDIVLAIKDQGAGIPPEVLKKIGTPFFTTKEQGTGLGLAICYNIAARHHAVINVETSDQGTTFYIKFNKLSYEIANVS